MLVYNFIAEEFALDDLRQRRLKVSYLSDMNDPFELLGGELRDPLHRHAFHQYKLEMNERRTVLCFSKCWHNPVLWSHYADKHKGMALGFEIPDRYLIEVSYKAKRLVLDLERCIASGQLDPCLGDKLLRTKFSDWAYEREVRRLLRPDELIRDGALDFYPFGKELKLRRVIPGVRCSQSEATLRPLLDADVKVIRARLAFNSFSVVKDRRGWEGTY